MSTVALSPALLFDGATTVENMSIVVRDGRVAELTDRPSSDAMILEGLLAPGFVDVQVNGGGGVLFNDAPSADALLAIARAHSAFGVTGLMATLISDDRGKMPVALAAMARAIDAGAPGLIGLHLEGPWLSEERRGVHPARYLRDFDAADLALLTHKRAFPIMITVAPERIDIAHIKALTEAGVIVCLGHTAASAEAVQAALAAGARGFTHLFNAMPPFEGRKPGPVAAALAHSDCYAGLILDGIHVHPLSARAAFAAKGADKLMLVSDSMATVGSADSSMSLWGERVSVAEGALRTASGTLAGAHLDLASAARNAITMLGASTEDALRMVSTTPAAFLGLESERGRLAPRARADFVLLDANLQVRSVWIAGEKVR